jgi:hypothetical protein
MNGIGSELHFVSDLLCLHRYRRLFLVVCFRPSEVYVLANDMYGVSFWLLVNVRWHLGTPGQRWLAGCSGTRRRDGAPEPGAGVCSANLGCVHGRQEAAAQRIQARGEKRSKRTRTAASDSARIPSRAAPQKG